MSIFIQRNKHLVEAALVDEGIGPTAKLLAQLLGKSTKMTNYLRGLLKRDGLVQLIEL